MPAVRRHYSNEEKARAVGTAIMKGSEAAAVELGIPKRTINWWRAQPEFAELKAKGRDEVADEMWATIQLGIAEVAKGILGDAPLKDKVIALGVLYDKHALLTGAATARTESRDITGTLSDAELVAALREAERITRESRTADAPASAPEG